jgi:bacillopeptidase F
LWLVNGVAASVTPAAARQLATLPGVARVELDATVHAPAALPATAAPPTWNLAAIHAPDVWALGADGSGAVVANMDTGVDLGHSDLASRWRGGAGGWWDPYQHTAKPYDAVGHGTGTMGILVGGSALGVAPGARWIAAKIFDDKGNTSLSVIHEGFQWLLAPNGVAADAPDVINASWGLSWVNLCDDTFQADVDALRAAGIFVVFSAGNSGPDPLTSISPANNLDTFAAGAVDQTNAIASFSSRGAGACNSQIFPDLVAPGVNVETTAISLAGVPQYQFVSGTSFAAPHVAGSAALLAGAFPNATIDELEAALRSTAHDLGTPGPDDDYGYGLLDAAAAYASLAAGNPLRVVTARAGDATRDRAYALPLAGAGGRAPYSWSLAAGSLPDGLTLDAQSGLVSGTPHGPSSRFTVALTDAAGTRATRTLGIDVYSIPWNVRNEALTPPRGGLTMTTLINRLIRTVVLPATTLAALAAPAHAEPHKQRAWARTTATYRVPDVALVRADGARVHLRHELDDGKPVILNFIFTSCSAICPVMTQTFAEVQRQLGDERVHLVSVSIDPEADTPAKLSEYARKLAAGDKWSFYTGSLEASIAAQKAFDVYRGDKMNHAPVTFIRRAPGQPWVRLDGFAAASDVVAEYRRLGAVR